MLKRLLNRLAGPRLAPDDLTREEARQILERTGDEARERLARRSDEADILAFLASDESPRIRALVAANPAAPETADLALADDPAGEVRAELARKIARLIPGLSARESRELSAHTLVVLDKLASDHLPLVRRIVAEEIKSSPHVPKAIVDRLARDAEIEVAAPILAYSPLLGDNDLLEIIATTRIEGVLSAIAKRPGLASEVADAVVASLDIPAVAALLANPSAKIRTETMDRIIAQAEGVNALHETLVIRPDLSMRAIRRIAGFVASSLLTTLSERHALDEETRAHITLKVRERIAEEGTAGAADDQRVAAIAAVEAAHRDGRIDDEFLIEAIKAEKRLQAVLALAAKARVPEAMAEKVLRSGKGQLVTALAWRAGLQMRTAFVLQKDLARVSPRDLVPARNGLDYPLPEDQMRRQLELVGIAPA